MKRIFGILALTAALAVGAVGCSADRSAVMNGPARNGTYSAPGYRADADGQVTQAARDGAGRAGAAVNDAARGIGNGVADMANGAKNSVEDMVRGAENAVDDMTGRAGKTARAR